MSASEARYKDLVKAYQTTFPDLTKQVQYQNAQKEWNKVKNSPDDYKQLMLSLKA